MELAPDIACFNNTAMAAQARIVIWRQGPRPLAHPRSPIKSGKMAAINEALGRFAVRTILCSMKMRWISTSIPNWGADWMMRGKQKKVA